jgi:hypothetical protein
MSFCLPAPPVRRGYKTCPNDSGQAGDQTLALKLSPEAEAYGEGFKGSVKSRLLCPFVLIQKDQKIKAS